MSRGAATFKQSDIDRLIRAAKKAGAAEIRIKIGKDAWASIPLEPGKPLAEPEDIVL
jgi:hypothetical protein